MQSNFVSILEFLIFIRNKMPGRQIPSPKTALQEVHARFVGRKNPAMDLLSNPTPHVDLFELASATVVQFHSAEAYEGYSELFRFKKERKDTFKTSTSGFPRILIVSKHEADHPAHAWINFPTAAYMVITPRMDKYRGTRMKELLEFVHRHEGLGDVLYPMFSAFYLAEKEGSLARRQLAGLVIGDEGLPGIAGWAEALVQGATEIPGAKPLRPITRIRKPAPRRNDSVAGGQS